MQISTFLWEEPPANLSASQDFAVAELIAELDAGTEWPDALFLISCEYNIPGDTLRKLFDRAAAREMWGRP